MTTVTRNHTACLSCYVRSWPALVMGLGLGLVTFFVLFEDVLKHDASITTDHVLTLAVLATVVLAGHMWLTQLLNLQIVTSVGLVLVFAAGSVYLVIASGGRNAEVMIAKRDSAAASESERVERLTKISEAEYILAPCPDGVPSRDVGVKCGLRDAMTRECASGKGTKCEGRSYSVATYAAAIEGHRLAITKLPTATANGSLKSTARVLVAWEGLTGEQSTVAEETYVARLELIIPYLKAVLVEIGTMVFIAVGVGHRRKPTAQPSATVAEPEPMVSNRRTTVTQPLDQDTARALSLLKRGERPQAEIVQLFGGDKSKASRCLSKLERGGQVKRTGRGRQKIVALA